VGARKKPAAGTKQPGPSSVLRNGFVRENEGFEMSTRKKFAGESHDSSRIFDDVIQIKKPFAAKLSFSAGC